MTGDAQRFDPARRSSLDPSLGEQPALALDASAPYERRLGRGPYEVPLAGGPDSPVAHAGISSVWRPPADRFALVVARTAVGDIALIGNGVPRSARSEALIVACARPPDQCGLVGLFRKRPADPCVWSDLAHLSHLGRPGRWRPDKVLRQAGRRSRRVRPRERRTRRTRRTENEQREQFDLSGRHPTTIAGSSRPCKPRLRAAWLPAFCLAGPFIDALLACEWGSQALSHEPSSDGDHRGMTGEPHCPETLPPPQVAGAVHVPHCSRLPQPSPAGPQVMFCCAQVSGVQTPPPPH